MSNVITPAAMRARIGRASRAAARNPSDVRARNEADEARRDYRAAQLAEYIQRTVDAAPPLTAEQRARLARILAPTVSGVS